MSERDLTVREAAKYCYVSVKMIYVWFDNGMLKGYLVPGSKHRRFRPIDVLKFCRDNKLPIHEDLAKLV